jgi:uncharacterized delta-60 repeat protein
VKRLLLLLALAVLALGLLAVSSAATRLKAGQLDPTFAKRGFVTQHPGGGDWPTAIALQRNGKIVIAGTWGGFVTSRYDANGTLDRSFGDDGSVTTSFTSVDLPYAVAVQRDGKILVAGIAGYNHGPNGQFGLVRYRKNGSLDPSFGNGGIVTTPFGTGNATVHSLALRPNGKIVATGTADSGNRTDLAVAQYNADGSLDHSFARKGRVLIALGTSKGYTDLNLVGAALQPNGKLVAVGTAGCYFCGASADLTRFNPNGSLDPRFGVGGEVVSSLRGETAGATAVAIAPDGKIVIGGSTDAGRALARFSARGSLDRTFGKDGVVDDHLFGPNEHSYLSGVAVAPDGSVIAVGTAGNINQEDLALARYRPDGRRDRSLGDGGHVTTQIPGWDWNFGDGVVLQPDGKIDVVGGLVDSTDPYRQGWVIARYRGAVCAVPRVKGEQLRKATRRIRRSHCSVGQTTRVFSPSVADGLVVAQRPRARKRLEAGTKVNLVVSKGKR